jgi:FixJ family two-component response regulator
MGNAAMDFGNLSRPHGRPPETQVTPVVYIVDDDVSVRESLELLIRKAGWQPISVASAREFLSKPQVFAPSCLILDVGLPDINGLDLQQQLAERYHPPIIFLTGNGDIRASVRAIQAGALDFLTKPFRADQLRELVRAALAQDCEHRAGQIEKQSLRQRYASLTPREREVLPLVVSGLLNKQAAAYLGISQITLQIHRTNVMRKMGAQSLAELVRMADALEIPLMNLPRVPRASAGLRLSGDAQAKASERSGWAAFTP